jgi:type IV secretory pathway VirD2 relaxase
MRAGGSRRSRKYLDAVLAAAARAGFPRAPSGRRFSGSRIGRGGVAARMLGDRHAAFRARRAIVKTRLVQLGGKGLGAARAHLRYIQRDGVTRNGESGRLYSAADDDADGKAFLERCGGDRHQFRLIVSAEDGAEYEDLGPLIRRFMARMEEDLGTRLDWVAADHVDTLHPHTHIMLRGKDGRGENLVIAPDYIKRGMRERLSGLLSLDLGPRTDLEIERRLRLDVHAERLTPLDRRLLRDMDGDRVVRTAGRNMFDHAARTGRLRKLGSLGLAEDLGGGKWRLVEDLEPTLRRLGEQGDIVRTMQRELARRGLKRTSADSIIHGHAVPERGVVGRVIARGLSDEHRDRHFLLLDGIDGRVHHVDIGAGGSVEPLPEGAIVQVRPPEIEPRASDRLVVAIAEANDGRYSIELHLDHDPGARREFAESYVRRLEALRRAGAGPERLADSSWRIPSDHLERVLRHEMMAARSAPIRVEILSPLPVPDLTGREAATWLDQQLAADASEPLRDAGFGREVRAALALRRQWLVERGYGQEIDGQFAIAPESLARLRQRELLATAARLGTEFGLNFVPTEEGGRVQGLLTRRVDLASGRFALVESGRDFTLVPWRPVLDRYIGMHISGVARTDGISWSVGRKLGVEI